MDSLSTTNVECECEMTDKPVDYLGDSVCKSSSGNVREIIRKYEPDRELGKPTRSVGSVSNQRSLTRSLKRVIFEETGANSMQSKGSRRRSLGTISTLTITPDVMNRSHFDMRSSIPLSDNAYKSKTTITRTSQGVRIATDILFSSSSNIPEQWVGRRIDTELPNSTILLDFESKNNVTK